MKKCKTCGADLPNPKCRFCKNCQRKKENARQGERRKQNEQEARKQEKEWIQTVVKKRMRPDMSIIEINKMARKLGTSYGKMVVEMGKCK